MSKIFTTEIKSRPNLDLMYYLEIAGERRIEHDVLVKLEDAWERWAGHISAYKLASDPDKNAKGFIIVYMDEEVEREVDEAWNEDPALGSAMQSLAVTAVMSTASEMVPELATGACAPLTEPNKDMQRAFKRLGLTWNEDGTVNRKYAVFTPYPYQGGCEKCFTKEFCPTSQTREFGQK